MTLEAYTHTHTFTTKNDFKKPCALAAGRHAPGLKTIANDYIAILYVSHAELLQLYIPETSFPAVLITQKVGESVNTQEGLCSMLEAFIAIGFSEPFLGAGIQQNV